MNEKRYIISDASKMLEVESHVLRYWEEELEIKIPRNEMGHRYYTENHINLLRNVRDLKKQGYGLRTIRMMIGSEQRELPEEKSQISKMEQFKEIMGEIVSNALKENVNELGKSIQSGINYGIKNELQLQLKEKEERDEERFRRLDEIIRSKQNKNRGKFKTNNEQYEQKRKKSLFGGIKKAPKPV
jgi:DNA-binding transcriptional MerR regulator